MSRADVSSDLLTTREVAALARVSTVTVVRWANDGRLPVIRVSERVLRFRRSDVEALLAVSGAES
jgi:excisionase family DNA binding protein